MCVWHVLVCVRGCGCGRCCLHSRIKPTKQQRKHTLALATRTNSCCNMIELSICCPFSVGTSHPTPSANHKQQRAQKGGTNVQQISVHCHVVCPAHRSLSLSLSLCDACSFATLSRWQWVEFRCSGWKEVDGNRWGLCTKYHEHSIHLIPLFAVEIR